MTDPEVSRLYDQELEPHERTLWEGRPNASRMVLKSLPIMLFAIPWTGFALFWIAGASGFKWPDLFNPGPQLFFPLFGVPFVLVGLAMLTAPYWVKRAARRTGYFVTDRRVLIIEKRVLGGFRIRTFLPAQLGQIERIQRADGSGDLIFTHEYHQHKNGTRTTPIGFLGIPEVREVEAVIKSVIARPPESALT